MRPHEGTEQGQRCWGVEEEDRRRREEAMELERIGSQRHMVRPQSMELEEGQ